LNSEELHNKERDGFSRKRENNSNKIKIINNKKEKEFMKLHKWPENDREKNNN